MSSTSSVKSKSLTSLESQLLKAARSKTGKSYFVSGLFRRKSFKQFKVDMQAAIIATVLELRDSVYKDIFESVQKADVTDYTAIRFAIEQEYGSVSNFMKVEGITDFLKKMYDAGGQRAANDTDIAGVFELRDPVLVDNLSQRSKLLIQSVDNTTKDELARMLSEGIAQGKSWQELASEVRQAYPDIASYRAELIARTETANAAGEAALQFYRENGFKEKRWILGGGNICEICQGNADEGWIPINDTFSSGDESFPAHPNCQCDLETKVDDDYVVSDTPWMGDKSETIKVEVVPTLEERLPGMLEVLKAELISKIPEDDVHTRAVVTALVQKADALEEALAQASGRVKELENVEPPAPVTQVIKKTTERIVETEKIDLSSIESDLEELKKEAKAKKITQKELKALDGKIEDLKKSISDLKALRQPIYISRGGGTTPGGGGVGAIVIQDQAGTTSGEVSTLKVTNGTLTNEGGGVFSLDTGGGGGSALAPQYHLVDYSALTIYSGINTTNDPTDSGWTIIKTVLSGANRTVRTVSKATDSWVNRATATYTPSLTYSN